MDPGISIFVQFLAGIGNIISTALDTEKRVNSSRKKSTIYTLIKMNRLLNTIKRDSETFLQYLKDIYAEVPNYPLIEDINEKIGSLQRGIYEFVDIFEERGNLFEALALVDLGLLSEVNTVVGDRRYFLGNIPRIYSILNPDPQTETPKSDIEDVIRNLEDILEGIKKLQPSLQGFIAKNYTFDEIIRGM
jgi:hypothetical protein